MAVTFNHTIIAAKDREEPTRWGPFTSVRPQLRRAGELNDNNGGRGFYCFDPAGHGLEGRTRAD